MSRDPNSSLPLAVRQTAVQIFREIMARRGDVFLDVRYSDRSDERGDRMPFRHVKQRRNTHLICGSVLVAAIF